MRDVRKLKEEASEASAKGKHRKAADLYVELARLEPTDPLWPHRAGEALRRLGLREESIAQLSTAADGYVRQGFLLKAISVAKMILEIDPNRGETQRMLASLYAKRDNSPSQQAVPASQTSLPPPSRPIRPPSIPLEEPAPSLASHSARPLSQGAIAVPPSLPLSPALPPRVGPPPIPQSAAVRPPPPAQAMRPATIPLAVEPKLSPIELEPALALEDAGVPLDSGSYEAFDIGIDAAPGSSLDVTPDDQPPGPPSLRLAKLGLPLEPASTSAPSPPPVDIASVSLVSDAPRPRHQRFPTIDRLPLAEVIPGARTTGAFSIPAIEIPLPAHRKSSSENVIGDVAGAMPRVPLFSSLDENRLHSLIVRSRVIVRDDGQAIVQQGDLGDTLYVIIRGEVDITIEGTSVPVNHLGEGEFFGELALLTEQPRLATVTARGEVELLEIGRDAIWDLIEDAPEVLQILLRFFRDRLIERLVATSPLFTEFSAAEARQLTERFQFLELHPETALITEGHRADGLFVLLCGACDVQSAAHGVIATLGPGDLCGEVSLLTRAPAAATVSTRGRVWALGLPRAEFQELILTHPQILIYVNELAESRRAAEGERKVALV